jgi:C1A family cysteine protease
VGTDFYRYGGLAVREILGAGPSNIPLPVRNYSCTPDPADHRDYSIDHPTVISMMRKSKSAVYAHSKIPNRVDWREFCGPIEDEQGLGTSAAHACVALIQHLERRSSGQLLQLSRLFLHYTARRMHGNMSCSDLPLRTVFKAAVRCGIPPEKYWPYDASYFECEPDGFAYTFQQDFRSLRYVRLDDRRSTGSEVLPRLQSFLTAGFPVAFGFPVLNSVRDDPDISYPKGTDTILGRHAVTAVGYDSQRRIGSDKGALLIRNSWGSDWGNRGYGWLPYSYVTGRLAVDFWTLLKPSWLRSGEFASPGVIA